MSWRMGCENSGPNHGVCCCMQVQMLMCLFDSDHRLFPLLSQAPLRDVPQRHCWAEHTCEVASFTGPWRALVMVSGCACSQHSPPQLVLQMDTSPGN